MNKNAALTIKECGREFSARELEIIRDIVETAIPALRAQIAREACEKLFRCESIHLKTHWVIVVMDRKSAPTLVRDAGLYRLLSSRLAKTTRFSETFENDYYAKFLIG